MNDPSSMKPVPAETSPSAPPPPEARPRTLDIVPCAQPWMGLDMRNADVACELFDRAAEQNLQSPLRKGSTVHLPGRGRVVMTGDLHDHGPNLSKIVRFANLEASPNNHVILHEVVHGDSLINGCDMSVRMLAKIAALKIAFPNQVHLLQSNHELAQYRGDGILKDSINVVQAFNQGVDYIYGPNSPQVTDAVRRFVRSYPLAIRSQRGLFFAHSLPSDNKLDKFDPAVLDREPTDADLEPGGAGYVLVWGRYQTQTMCEELAKKLGVDLFVVGHQPAEMGYELINRSLMVLASNHEHGMVLDLDLGLRYDMDKLVDALVPLAGLTG